MAPDAMTVRLHLQRLRVVKVLADVPERLEVLVEDLHRVVRCPHCGFRTAAVHDRRRVRVTDLAYGGGPPPWCGNGAVSAAGNATNGSWRSRIPSSPATG
jgi:hypothetical protein